ncbi:unnamed protein product [Leptidea sinapis]|uniref:uridine/cytidine kinase n=1 Tax=Leptidea sinapis TaxID=189913 RepID=A0A5E4QG39_9NEOP|nr:unnamed protein product [Leptidea sinapis]
MAGKINKFETPSSASSDSDSELALEISEQVFLDDEDYSRAPASPTTVPNVRPYRPPSTGSNILKSPRARRVRTTSMSRPNKKTTAESILHADRRTIYTAGRPPWYNCTGGQEVEPFLIVAAKIIESLNIPWVTIVSMDSFYKVLNEKQHQAAARNEYNFDHPDAFDMELLVSVLQRLREGKKKTMYGANVIIFEGILAFYNAQVLQLLDMKVDIVQRGRELEGVLHQYMRHVKPAYQSYIAPSMAHADIIVPRGGENKVAISLIVHHLCLSSGSNILKSPRARRVRTTSMSRPNKKTTAESILHADRRTIYTAGRPPWYNCTGGQEVEPFLIVAAKIIESLNIPWVTIVSMDSFYKVLNEKQHQAAARNEYNFDHPDAFDMELLVSVLQRLREGKKKTMYGANVIIFEGILAFYNAQVLQLLDMKVDIVQRGRELEGVLHQYMRHVKPAYQSYIAPSMAHADIIVPRGGENKVAISLIVHHVHKQNKDTPRDEFIFYSKRLMRLVIEFALSLLPYSEYKVDTPQGFTYTGVLYLSQLYYLRLPKDIKDYRVILMDATVATGAAAMMAIRVLLDHDVPEHNISLVSLLMAEIGVKIVTSALDPEINEKFYVLPGIGNFGDRYFGTEPTDEE